MKGVALALAVFVACLTGQTDGCTTHYAVIVKSFQVTPCCCSWQTETHTYWLLITYTCNCRKRSIPIQSAAVPCSFSSYDTNNDTKIDLEEFANAVHMSEQGAKEVYNKMADGAETVDCEKFIAAKDWLGFSGCTPTCD